jgi:ribosomal protein L37E
MTETNEKIHTVAMRCGHKSCTSMQVEILPTVNVMGKSYRCVKCGHVKFVPVGSAFNF